MLFGFPPKENPFYFVLGECKTLFKDFGDGVGVLQIELDTIDIQDITLTLGDSMGVYFNSPNKKLYTISEFLSMNPEIINNEFTFLQDFHRYIEVQHWNKSKIEKSNITISYPLFLYIQVLYSTSASFAI